MALEFAGRGHRLKKPIFTEQRRQLMEGDKLCLATQLRISRPSGGSGYLPIYGDVPQVWFSSFSLVLLWVMDLGRLVLIWVIKLSISDLISKRRDPKQ